MKNNIQNFIKTIFFIGCLSHLNAQSFTSTNDESNIHFIHDGPLVNEDSILDKRSGDVFSTGACWLDYNNDGWLDLYLSMRVNDNKFYKNNGDGTFTEIGQNIGLNAPNTDAAGIVAADFNNDGWIDIFVCNMDQDYLFKNINGQYFENISTSAGFAENDRSRGISASWGDYDNDGYLDLYVANHMDRRGLWYPTTDDKLYHNNGDETFTDVSYLLEKENRSGHSFIAGWTDFDRDGDLDILLVTDCQANTNVPPTRIFENQGGNNPLTWSFREVSVEVGLDDCRNGMGLAVGDFNRDGWMDISYTNIGEVVLYQNTNGHFTDVTSLAGIGEQHFLYSTWGASMFDYNLDGWQDLLFAAGTLERKERYEKISHRNALYINNQNGRNFNDLTNSSGIGDPLRSRSMVSADYDKDGDLDIYTVNYGEVSHLMTNNLDKSHNYISIQLEGTCSNRDGIGAYIILTTEDNNTQYYETRSGSNLGGGDTPFAHFGLGTNSQISSIIVEWPSGQSQSLQDIEVNQHLLITEPYLANCPSCHDGIMNRDEEKVDCGGSRCGPCDCLNSTTDKIIFSPDRDTIFHIKDNFIIDEPLQISSDTKVEYKAEKSIEISAEFENVLGSQLILDIENCITHNLCEYTTLCNTGIHPDSLNNYSIARLWMEILLEAIRKDLARPTVHARNLFHSSIMMYDIWHLYNSILNDNPSNSYLINKSLHEITCPLIIDPQLMNISDINEVLSFAMYRLISHRFKDSPGVKNTFRNINGLFELYGYNINYKHKNYETGNPADIGNYIADCFINYGLSDGSNETEDYANQFYTPINPPLKLDNDFPFFIEDPNRWQPLSIRNFVDQSGNRIRGTTLDFLSPEWGQVYPFALDSNDITSMSREGNIYSVYHDPGPPPMLSNALSAEWYKSGFEMVGVWSSHLDPADTTRIDISPKSIGNFALPEDFDHSNIADHYDFYKGGGKSPGHDINPSTHQPYQTQLVLRSDYGRVIAEYWADGPESETPPGHWFTILNKVSDNVHLAKRIGGQGQVLSTLEWDIKSYMVLGGAMHDAAISAWSIKGYYDYIRPISAIRHLAAQGQSSDPSKPNYSATGISLIAGLIEQINVGDSLAGLNNEYLGEIKIKAWNESNITDQDTDIGGVDWILAERWMPYQRPSFVTPPFAGYVSGHSTFSRAAAEVLTLLTGDPFFPGGMGTFEADQDDFLVFEKGPSEKIILQWATYRDAADQSAISRIWGGIHPPADDIPGRIIGRQIGIDAFNYAKSLFNKD